LPKPALARRLDLPLVTADQSLAQKLAASGLTVLSRLAF
jgi:predicted nucleic acid-binding protein